MKEGHAIAPVQHRHRSGRLCQHVVRYGPLVMANWRGTRHAAEGFQAQSAEKHPATLCTRA